MAGTCGIAALIARTALGQRFCSHHAHTHLQPLLAFLGEVPYGVSRDAWLGGVQRPLEARLPWGRQQLMALLRRVMIRWARQQGIRQRSYSTARAPGGLAL